MKADGKPLGVEILGRTVTLFRDPATNVVRCLDDVCPHRGAPLHKGWVTQVEPLPSSASAAAAATAPGGGDSSGSAGAGGSCVVCPYHGWAFDGEGRLAAVPSAEERGRWPRRPLVDSYPVEEKVSARAIRATRGGCCWGLLRGRGPSVRGGIDAVRSLLHHTYHQPY